MAHLTKPPKYEIEGSNIELFGSDIEKRVHEHAGDTELAWTNAGDQPGLQVWRIQNFGVQSWPKERLGTFYDGDAYIVLHTYKKGPDLDSLAYDLHFWLGHETSQDEAGTAAYKTVELDDHLHGAPIQYREVQGSESTRFLSYFPRFTCLHGGTASGFHHVTSPPPADVRKLYRISGDTSRLVVREVPPEGASLVKGDTYVLDRGTIVWQLNTMGSSGKEKFKAAEVAHELAEARKGACNVEVFDEGGRGAGKFLAEFELEGLATESEHPRPDLTNLKILKISDASTGSEPGLGEPSFESIDGPPTRAHLSSSDAFIIDAASTSAPTIFVWVGKDASISEGKYALRYAERYVKQIQIQDHAHDGNVHSNGVTLVKLKEGNESGAFTKLLTV